MEIGMKGRNFSKEHKPLSISERTAVIEAAKNSRTAATVATLLPLFSGLRAMAVPHIKSDMVTVIDDDELRITLPPGTHECDIIGSGRMRLKVHGTGGDRACSYCDDGTFSFEKPRAVPVFEKEAVEVISDWFSLYDYMPSHKSICNMLATIEHKSGVQHLTLDKLRHTYGVMLASKGFSRPEIRKAMGMPEYPHGAPWTIVAYGQLSKGEYPFICGVEKARGGKCRQQVIEGRCSYHTEENQCGVENSDRKGKCERHGAYSDGRCHYHTNCE